MPKGLSHHLGEVPPVHYRKFEYKQTHKLSLYSNIYSDARATQTKTELIGHLQVMGSH